MAYGLSAKIVEEVLAQCPEAKVILIYGSAARGEARADSDIDVLVTAEARCRVELGSPYSVVVLTMDEWFRVGEEFRWEVLRDAILAYARGVRLRDLVVGEPWLLVHYTSSNPQARSCASRLTSSLSRRGLLEKVAPGVVLAPQRAARIVLEGLEACGARVAGSRAVLYRVWRGFCGYCPYCGFEVVGGDYEVVKRGLREHLLGDHRDIVVDRAERLRREGKGLPGGSLKGLAGYMASMLVREC